MELLKEKEAALEAIMPDLEELYSGKPHEEEVYIYRGIEGWKNFMRDILRIGENVFILGGKGAWADKKIGNFREQFLSEASRKDMKIKVLYDIEIKNTGHDILKLIKDEHRFLPADFSTTSAVTVFGNHVVIQSNIKVGNIDENATSTVIINKSIADTFRTWFELMWSVSRE